MTFDAYAMEDSCIRSIILFT